MKSEILLSIEEKTFTHCNEKERDTSQCMSEPEGVSLTQRLDFSILREGDTWRAFGVAVVLFCIIGYSSLSLFGMTSSIYGVSGDVNEVYDFEAQSLNRTGIDSVIADENGTVQLSSLRGSVVILDFMAVDCANCHYVQEHIQSNIAEWSDLEGEYPVIVISVAAWYGLETFAQINSTFGDPDSEKFMNWTVVNGGPESIILENGCFFSKRGLVSTGGLALLQALSPTAFLFLKIIRLQNVEITKINNIESCKFYALEQDIINGQYDQSKKIVVKINRSELSRGRRGPSCMTMPLETG